MKTPSTTVAQTIDEKFKSVGEDRIQIEEHTRDSCDIACDVVITTTTDGDVFLKPGKTKYFQIDKVDEYTRSGGWRWKCCKSPEQSRIRGATYIKAVRKNDTGAIDWYWVTLLH